MGGLQLLKEIVEKNNVKVRILVPADAEAKLTIKRFQYQILEYTFGVLRRLYKLALQ